MLVTRVSRWSAVGDATLESHAYWTTTGTSAVKAFLFGARLRIEEQIYPFLNHDIFSDFMFDVCHLGMLILMVRGQIVDIGKFTIANQTYDGLVVQMIGIMGAGIQFVFEFLRTE